MLSGVTQDLSGKQLNRFADVLQSVLIFPGQLKDESVGEERHENLPRASVIEISCEVAERPVDSGLA